MDITICALGTSEDDQKNVRSLLKPNDTFYIFSDGYVDQFGGEKGKKLKAKAFREILVSIQEMSMEDQKTFLDQKIEEWRGGLEQVDDICVIGVRV
jgi:serine phosphatase RsbU (regulator of sigma subunit)